VRVGAAPTTTGRAGTARRLGSGKRDGKVYVRNQRLNASQERPTSSNLADLGWVAARARCCVRATSAPVEIAGGKAISNVCGVDVARPQEQSWAPHLSNGHEVNVGTVASVPSPPGRVLGGGNARCRRMPARWDGGPVVVRGRESRSHGEGVQRDRRRDAERGGRW
jgi:hypothetical protein